MRQVQSYAESWRGRDHYVLVLIWTEDSQIFRAEFPDTRLPKTEVEVDELLNKAIGQPNPNDHLFPPWSDTLTEAKQPLSSEAYVKMRYPNLISYHGKSVSERFMADVQALEIISKRDLIRTSTNIMGAFEMGIPLEIPADQAPPFYPDVIISGITAGIDHIHSFGIVHGDINPQNIMLDKAGNPVIIDFDTCVALGAHCPSPGTPGWAQIQRKSPGPGGRIAVFENDTYGFDLVAKFVRGEYDGLDFGSGFDDFDDLDSEELQDQEKHQETNAEPLISTSSPLGEMSESIILNQDSSPLSPPHVPFAMTQLVSPNRPFRAF